jgi:hypothetical protein
MMSQQEYKVLIQGLKGLRKLVPINQDIYDLIGDKLNTDWYQSIFRYSQNHYDHLAKTKSLAGITDVYTNTLVWDLDSHTDINTAKNDAITLCNTLTKTHKIPEDSIQVAFSGRKGFSIIVHTQDKFTVEEFKSINRSLASDLSTNDPVVADPQRIFRVLGTKHNVTGLHKFPLTIEQLNTLSMEEIQTLAQDINNADPNLVYFKVCKTPDSILALRKVKVEIKPAKESLELDEIDFTKKPKGFTNCRFAIMNGVYPAGNRNNSLMALAAACRAQNYPKEIAYNVCKGSIRLQSQRYEQEPFPKDELWKNIIEQVYGETWNGGAFSCKKEGWLQDFCNTLGKHKCKHNDDVPTVKTDDVFNLFQNYAKNYEKNILTTGIKPLDDKIKFLVGTSAGILAPPGVGKTSLSLSMLNHNSKKDTNSIFFSYDMFHSMVYLRLIQKHTGYNQEKIFELFKHDKREIDRIKAILTEEYKNVNFCFKSGQTPDEIEQTIIDTEEKTGSKVKLVIVDYNELVIAPSSDPTQASAQVAQRLRQIANDRETCVVTLLQPSKIFSNPSDEITSYQGAKGSGAIAQSLTLMLSLSRPGFSPRNPEQDKFFTINCLKNRNGGLFTVDAGWEGLKGSITELGDDERQELEMIRQKKQVEKASESSY